MAYIWPKVLPADVKPYFEAPWMTATVTDSGTPTLTRYARVVITVE